MVPSGKAGSRAPANSSPNDRDQDALLASLRDLGMRLLKRLEEFEAGAIPDEDRLLGRGDGLIDGFNALARTVVRIIDKERRIAAIQDATPRQSPIDADELDRRISAELSRIAARRRASASGAPDSAGEGGQGVPG